MQTTITPNLLSAIAGIVLSLLASYLPGFSTWFAGLEPTKKRLFMAAIVAGAALIVVLLSCTNLAPLVTCEKASVTAVIEAAIAALVANQAAYQLTPQTADVKAASAKGKEMEAASAK